MRYDAVCAACRLLVAVGVIAGLAACSMPPKPEPSSLHSSKGEPIVGAVETRDERFELTRSAFSAESADGAHEKLRKMRAAPGADEEQPNADARLHRPTPIMADLAL